MVRLTHHGKWEMVIGTLLLAAIGAGLWWVWWPLALVPAAVLVWLFAFFRDPDRAIPGESSDMVSPADGMVSDITELPEFELLGGPCVRVGIFLSVFNVHVNRAPCDGQIVAVIYKSGKFLNAMNHGGASEHNESNTLVMALPGTETRIAVVKQIVGLIARRIVCTAKVDDVVARGQRIGMIKFGSRTELYIPRRMNPQVQVKVGQHVRGAADIIARVQMPGPPEIAPRQELRV